MVVEQYFDDADGSGFALELDFERLRMRVIDHPNDDLDATFDSIEDMDAAYRERIANTRVCTNINMVPVPPIGDLVEHRVELAARNSFDPPPADATPLDVLVGELANTLRYLLNESVGPDPVEIEIAIFCLDDYGLHGIMLDPPQAVGKTDDELLRVFKKHPFGAWMGEHYVRARYSLEDNPLGKALAAYGDPRNLYDPVVNDLLYLVCAQLEANPSLRSNIEIAESPRFYFVFHDAEESILFEQRALAAKHVARPAAEYFEACR